MQKVVAKEQEPLISGYYRFGDTRHIFSDTDKIKSLGWIPAHGIEDSISDYWQYINSQQDMDNTLEYSEKQMKQLRVIRQTKSAR
jgi:dTDP-L-rhamnose 4-epimerase